MLIEKLIQIKIVEQSKPTKANSWETIPSGGNLAPKPNAGKLLALKVLSFKRFTITIFISTISKNTIFVNLFITLFYSTSALMEF